MEIRAFRPPGRREEKAAGQESNFLAVCSICRLVCRMDEPHLSTSTSDPLQDAPSLAKQGLLTKIILGSVAALALVVVIVQLVFTFSDRGKAPEKNFIVPEPESPSPTEPEAPVVSVAPSAPPSAAAQTASRRAKELAERLGNDTTSLIGLVVELSERLDLAEEDLEGARTLFASAARKAGKLEKTAATAHLLSAEVEILRTQLAKSTALLDVAERRSEALMKKLAASPDPETLREARAMRDVFEAELRNTKQRLARDEAEKARLRADLNAATSELAATETVLESTALFIESIELLPNAAKQLFLELSRLETVEKPELEKNYRLIEQNLGARVIDTIRFATGSSELSLTKAASISAAMAAGRNDSFFLVIGYASKTGSFDLNKSLSSARATAVATRAVETAQPGQKIRAVFLGQTNRFSSRDIRDDQICELWEVPK